MTLPGEIFQDKGDNIDHQVKTMKSVLSRKIKLRQVDFKVEGRHSCATEYNIWDADGCRRTGFREDGAVIMDKAICDDVVK